MNPQNLLEHLDSQERDLLIADSLMFMSTITRLFGAEKGMDVWQAISDSVDPSLKHEIFLRMLCGETSQRVKFRCGSQTLNAVGVIKAIRTATGLGLKEAKDIWDLSRDRVVTVDVSDHTKKKALISELRSLGAEIV